MVDGRIDPEEWDELAAIEGGKAFFQWQPQIMHFAATLPPGKDLLISADIRADGWLIGRDNLEIRLRSTATGVDVQTRILDATAAAGPQWSEATAFQASAKAAAMPSEGGTSMELSLTDPGKLMLIKDSNRKMGLRVDVIDSAEGSHEPFLPRVMTNVSLDLDRSTGLPEGMNFKPEYKGRSVVPGDRTRIRLTFNGKPDAEFRRIEVRTEGFARDVTGMTGVPFPAFDKKGRAFVDYETTVMASASSGYRVLRATVVDASGRESVVQSSFEIAPTIDFELVPPKIADGRKEATTHKLVVYVRSNTVRRVEGLVSLQAPAGWEVKDGNGEAFSIYNSRGSARRVFEVTIPADARGPFPILMKAVLGAKTVDQTLWMTIP